MSERGAATVEKGPSVVAERAGGSAVEGAAEGARGVVSEETAGVAYATAVEGVRGTAAEESRQRGAESQQGPAAESGSLASPAQIKLVYESRDKKFCLFEDANGHLTAVRTSRLA